MEVLFVAGFAPITAEPERAGHLYRETLGLPLRTVAGDYVATDDLEGVKHFGVWPLTDAAQSCFGEPSWPEDVPVPQATIEFEVADVEEAAAELEAAGYTLIHGARTEPWGQTLARLLDPGGLLIGVSHTPWLRGDT